MMKTGKNTPMGVIFTALIAVIGLSFAACGGGGGGGTTEDVPVTGVTLNQSSITLVEGDTASLTATVLPNNATNRAVTWSTSNAEVATVSNGRVTAVAEGSAVITVTTVDGSKTAFCSVTVNPVVGGDPTPVVSDFIIENLTQALGSVTPVTITPLPGKSDGEITIYYNGNIALPSTEGSYTVTFDVAATDGWRAATGLSAGTLQIVGYQLFASVAALRDYLYETSDTVIFAKLNNVDMTALKSLLTQMNNSKDIYLDLSGSTINSIGASAFEDCTSLAGINLPNSVATIGNRAFYGTSLTSINISNNVSSIGNEAFGTCASLTEISVGPYNAEYSSQDGVLYNKAGTTLVAYPTGKTGAFTIPDSVTGIGQRAFYNCTNLSVTIGNGITSIVEYAFYGCTNLSITIPNSVTNMYRAFSGCTNLSVTIDIGTSSSSYFPGCTNISVTIADGVTSIRDNGFGGFDSLTSITIPNSVTSIESNAFQQCTGLTSVNIPDSVTSIDGYAFHQCTNLTSVTIPNSVTSIGEGAFAQTAWLNNQPDGLVYAGKVAYKYKGTMPANTNITLLDGTKGIAGEAFKDCTGLTGITIPNSVTSIGGSAFSSCTNLASVTIPNGVTSIGVSAFQQCTSLTSVTIPNSVESIGAWAFSSTGITSVTIPNSITIIEGGVFGGCTSLTGITIPASVTSIGAWAFSSTGITSVTIPNSVTSIGASAFSDCTSLTSVTFEGTITESNLGYTTGFTFSSPFPGDLRTKYLATTGGGIGTYTRPSGSDTWTKS